MSFYTFFVLKIDSSFEDEHHPQTSPKLPIYIHVHKTDQMKTEFDSFTIPPYRNYHKQEIKFIQENSQIKIM